MWDGVSLPMISYIFDTATYNLTCGNHATWAQCYAFIPSVLVRKSVSGNRLAI